MKFGLVVANIPNLVANDYKSHVVVNGMITFWLISTSVKVANMLWKGVNMSNKDIWKELVLLKSLNNMKMGKKVLV